MRDKHSSQKRKGNPAKSWPIGYRWLAVGTVIAYSAAGTTTYSVASAQEAKDIHQNSGFVPDTPGGLPARRYEISSGPLSALLDTFRQVSGLKVELSGNDVGKVQSPGVTGVYTVEQALKQLLSGTAVSYRFVGADGVKLELAGPNASIEVTERLSPTSPKYTSPLRDLPQTVIVLPKTLIEEQGATSLRDVLRNVPGVTMTAGEGGVAAGDNINVRGFSARNDIFVDGSRDLGPQSRDPFNLEQVEIVKGPQSAFSGRGSTGGAVNLVSKQPGLSKIFGGNINLGTDGTRRFAGDMNVPLERLGLGERTAFRLNAMNHHSGVAGRDVVENNRWGVAPSLAFGLGTPTRMTLAYSKLKQDNIPDYGIPFVPATNNALVAYRDQPAPVPRDTFYGLRNRDFERLNSDTATVRVEHDFSDGITLRNQLRYGRSTRDSLTTPPRFLNTESTTINREARSWLTKDSIWDNQTDFTARFETGRIRHAVVAGANFINEGNIRNTRTTTGTSTTTMLNPNADDVFVGDNVPGAITGDVTGKTQAVYAFDTVQFGQHFEANGGMRWERFDTSGINTTGVSLARVDRMKSVRAGLVYKPVQRGSVYASYGSSLNPSLEGLSYNTANTAIEPEKTYTVEVGTKWDVFRERLMVSGAIFRVDKDNARTPGVNDGDPVQVLQGTQRVKGIELGATGNITRTWKVFGGYTLLDSRIAASNTPAEVGKRFINTPGQSASVWTTYDRGRLMVGGGPRFVGKRYGNNTNTRVIDSYWTIDVLAAWRVTSKFDVRFNMYNANDAYYFDRIGGGHLIPGSGRAANFSTNFRF